MSVGNRVLVCGPERELETTETSRAVGRFQKNAPYSPAKEQPKGPALCSIPSKPRLEATLEFFCMEAGQGPHFTGTSGQLEVTLCGFLVWP